MLGRLFPVQFDNHYRGHWLGLWLFVPVVLMELAMGVNSVINTRMVAMSADGIPLDRYTAGGAEAVIAIFAIAGLMRLLIALQGAVVMLRYRAMVPFNFLLLLILQLGSRLLVRLHPIVRSVAATTQLGQAFVLAVLAMTAVGLVLSLLNRNEMR